MNKYVLHTFGCKVNVYDSGLLQKRLAQSSWEEDPTPVSSSTEKARSSVPARVHILNTCAVTAEASKEALKLSRRIKSREPFSKVVVTGCAAQVDTEMFEQVPSVDLVIANSHKASLPFLIEQSLRDPSGAKVFKSKIFEKQDLEPGGGIEKLHTRSFLKIQDGCDSFCSFCIIPYARGRSRSLSVADLVQRAQELEAQGVAEVVLTGVHIGDYVDPSTGFRLEDCVQQLLKRTQKLSFRLTSLEPIELNERLFQCFENPRLQPHFHMSIQSAESRVLSAMKRKYGEAEVRWALEEIARRLPHAFVGLDVIAGFPTETEEEFETVYRVLSETPWTKLHVFPYSERKGTKALTLPPVALSVRQARARRLRELSQQRWLERARAQIGSTKTALVLSGGTRALSSDYWNLQLPSPREVGTWIHAQVQSVSFESESLVAQ